MTVIINNDIDKFIRHVKAPTNINVNEEIQQLLVDNIDKLCQIGRASCRERV